jgi:putative DNA primase/helicase
VSREEVRRNAELAARDANVVELSDHTRYAATDLGNAQMFAALHGDRFRFVPAQRRWLAWDRTRWREDVTGEAERAAKVTARELLNRAVKLEGLAQKDAVRWAMHSQAEPRLRAMLTVAGTEEGIALAPDDLDANPWLLSCDNGTLDLRSGELRPNDPADLISLGTDVPYDPDATCPRWLQFLREVFDGDQDLVGFVRRAVGYSLTGDTREHVLFVLHGAGCNGKTTFVEQVQKVAGDLSQTSPFDAFMRVYGRGVRNDIARLHRSRLVVAAESGEGRRLDEATVKLLTGGDTVAARLLYREFFEFQPAFKLWLVTNHRPRVDGDDDAIWRRIRLIPFDVSFEGREDQQLAAKLDAELPGILAWAVAGCLEWQRHSLGLPDAVKNATREYREDEDVLGAFIDEHCTLDGEVLVATLRMVYDAYATDLGEKPLAANILSRRLSKRGITTRKTTGGKRAYVGITLKDEEWR